MVTQCYSLIYLVPDRVLRWLGVGSEQSMVSEPLRAAESTQQRIAEPGSQMGQGMIRGTQDTGQTLAKNWKTIKENRAKKFTGTTT